MASAITLLSEVYLEDSRSPGSPGWLPTLHLNPQSGFVPQRINVGFPDIRDQSERRPAQDGTYDFTATFGARAITLEVGLAHEIQDDPQVTDETLEDTLRSWMLPSVRAYLYYRRRPNHSLRRVLVRAANLSSPVNLTMRNEFPMATLSFRGIDGIFESAELQEETLEPSADVETGRSYDQAYDKTYPASLVIGAKEVVNYGNAPTFPTLQIHGPCTGPRVENQTTDKRLIFLPSYSLVLGEYLEIDLRNGTVYLNGDPTNSRYDKIDFGSNISDWWNLIKGPNTIRYYPLSSSAPSKVLINWRSAFL